MATTRSSGGKKLSEELRRIAERLSKAKTLRVGFLEKARYPNGTPVAMVAAIQDGGAPKAGIPPRPFFRNMIAKQQSTWAPTLARALRASDYDSNAAFRMLGEVMVGQLKMSIRDTNSPALSQVTLLLRQRFWSHPQDIKFRDVQKARRDVASGAKSTVSGTQGKPLVWTAHMLNSADYDIKS